MRGRLVVWAGLLAAACGLFLAAREPAPAPAAGIAVDWAALRHWAAAWSLPVGQVAARLRDAGVTHALVREVTLADLAGAPPGGDGAGGPVQVAVVPGGEAAGRGLIGLGLPLPPEAVRPDRLYVVVRDNPDLAAWLAGALALRLGADQVGRPGPNVVAVKVPVTPDLWHLPLLPLPQDAALAQSLGLTPVAGIGERPAGVQGLLPVPPEPLRGEALAAFTRPVPGSPGRLALGWGVRLPAVASLGLAQPAWAVAPVPPGIGQRWPGRPPAAMPAGAPGGWPAGVQPWLDGSGSVVRAHWVSGREGPGRWADLARRAGARLFVLAPLPEALPSREDALQELQGTVAALQGALTRAGLVVEPARPGAWPGAAPSLGQATGAPDAGQATGAPVSGQATGAPDRAPVPLFRWLGLGLLALGPGAVAAAAGPGRTGLVAWAAGALLLGALARLAWAGPSFWVGTARIVPPAWWLLAALPAAAMRARDLGAALQAARDWLARPAGVGGGLLLLGALGALMAWVLAPAPNLLPPAEPVWPSPALWRPEPGWWVTAAAWGWRGTAPWLAAGAAAAAALTGQWPEVWRLPLRAAAMAAVAQSLAAPGTVGLAACGAAVQGLAAGLALAAAWLRWGTPAARPVAAGGEGHG